MIIDRDTKEIASFSLMLKNIEDPTENEILFEIVRRKRNQLLSETDWWCASDRTPTQAQLDYRQALRDLPAYSTPGLDENGNLIGVTWPEKPE